MLQRFNLEDEEYIQKVREYVLRFQDENPDKLAGHTCGEYDIRPLTITWKKKSLDIITSILYNDMLFQHFDSMEETPYSRHHAIRFKHTSNALKVAMWEKRLK